MVRLLMLRDKLIGFCIPTYNRADVLKANLLNLIEILEPYGFYIYISDNCSTDHTESVVQSMQLRYQNIVYSRNNENIGYDRNCANALNMAKSEYIWLLSDHFTLTKEFCKIVDMLKQKNMKLDLLILGENKKLQDRLFTNSEEVLVQLSGELSNMSGTILNSKLIQTANFERYFNSQFIHTGIILESLSTGSNVKVMYLNNVFLNYLSDIKKNRWSYSHSAFEIFSSSWINTIMSLPTSYSLNAKRKAILSLPWAPFSLYSLITYRYEGLYDLDKLQKEKESLLSVLTYKYYIIMLAIALCPRFILKGARIIKNILCRMCNIREKQI